LGNLEHNTLRYIMPPAADYAGALHKTCADCGRRGLFAQQNPMHG
jgi:hypothetical protein